MVNRHEATQKLLPEQGLEDPSLDENKVRFSSIVDAVIADMKIDPLPDEEVIHAQVCVFLSEHPDCYATELTSPSAQILHYFRTIFPEFTVVEASIEATITQLETTQAALPSQGLEERERQHRHVRIKRALQFLRTLGVKNGFPYATSLRQAAQGFWQTHKNSLEISESRFYESLSEAIEAFFGRTYEDPKQIPRALHEVMAQSYQATVQAIGLIDKEGNLDSSQRIEHITGRIHTRIHELSERKSGIQLRDLIAHIFNQEDRLASKALISERVVQLTDQLPREVKDAITNFLLRFPKEEVPASAFKGALKSVFQRLNSENIDEQRRAQIDEAKHLLHFLHSVETTSHQISLEEIELFCLLQSREKSMNPRSTLGIDEHSVRESILKAQGHRHGHRGKSGFVNTLRDKLAAQAGLHSMKHDDFMESMRLLFEIASGRLPIGEVVIRTGIGGSADPMPFRVLSYAIPSLLMAERFQKSFGECPRVELFTGQEGAIACNGREPEKIRANTQVAFTATDFFVHNFFPEIHPYFETVEDLPWDEHPALRSVVHFLIQKLEMLERDDPVLSKYLFELRRRGSSHGGENGAANALAYAAFHVICFQDIAEINQFLRPDFRPAPAVVSMGSHAEVEYDYIRNRLKAHFNLEEFRSHLANLGIDTTQLTSTPLQPPIQVTGLMNPRDLGTTPPYYPTPHDFALADLGKRPIRDLIQDSVSTAFVARYEVRSGDTAEANQTITREIGAGASTLGSLALIAFAVNRTGEQEWGSLNSQASTLATYLEHVAPKI